MEESKIVAAVGYGLANAQNVSRAIQPRDRATRSHAVALASRAPGSYNIQQVLAIYGELRNKWRYVNDPRGADYWATASESVSAGGSGDCDDFAIALASVIEAIGGRARVLSARGTEPPTQVDPVTGGHAWAEVLLGPLPGEHTQEALRVVAKGSRSVVHYQLDPQGNAWLNLDWWAEHAGGPYYMASDGVAFYTDQEPEILQLKAHTFTLPPATHASGKPETPVKPVFSIRDTGSSYDAQRWSLTVRVNVVNTGDGPATDVSLKIEVINDVTGQVITMGPYNLGTLLPGRVNSYEYPLRGVSFGSLKNTINYHITSTEGYTGTASHRLAPR